MVTADLIKNTREKLEQLHASSVIFKPYDIKNILKKVQDVNA
jgi:hypothetical protein